MPTYKAPVEDVLFLLNDVFHIERYNNLPGFAEASPDLVEAILGEAAKFCEEVLSPLNRVGDAEGCTRHDDASVTTPKGFKEAYRQLTDGGWIGISAPVEFGGQGLPAVMTEIVNEFLCSANMAFAMYPLLTQGAISALYVHGSPEQKTTYLPPMIAGKWTGTMNLTEAHCGTDLGQLRSKAVPQPDGTPGKRNGVSCGSIEEKMGIHGNSTCVMNYDGAAGWLVGQANRGLNAMFTMMNGARLGVGVQGLAQSEVAYQNAAAYAKERLQGRSLSGAKFPDKAADPIIVHPDVRRTLLSIRSFNEAARAFVVCTALQADVVHRAEDDAARRTADDYMGLMTPVIKGVLTDTGFANAVMAQQVFGGHGYIRESGMEQFVRDARIAMIYEGANGIQALDLVGRKLGKDGGRAVTAFFTEMKGFLEEHAQDQSLQSYLAPLGASFDHLQQATMWFMQNALSNPDHAGAGAADYMHLFGLVVLGYMWCRMVAAARHRLAAGADGAAQRLSAKLVTARFFMERMLPETAAQLARIKSGAASTMALPAEAF